MHMIKYYGYNIANRTTCKGSRFAIRENVNGCLMYDKSYYELIIISKV